MRLSELDPKWLLVDGRRVGFVFRCPLWDQGERYQWWQTCFFESGIKMLTCPEPACYQDPDLWCCEHSQIGLVKVAGGNPDRTQGCKRDCAWVPNGPWWPNLDNATWDQLSVTPSLDGSAGGLWHGHITNGQIVGGI